MTTDLEIFQYMDANPEIKDDMIRKVKQEGKSLQTAFMEVCGEMNQFDVWETKTVEMDKTWNAIEQLNDLDKMTVLKTIKQGISHKEAYKMYKNSFKFEGKESFPVKVRNGKETIPYWVIETVTQLKKELKGNGVMPNEF